MSTLFAYIIFILVYNVESLEICSIENTGLECQIALLNGQKDLRVLDIEEGNGPTISVILVWRKSFRIDMLQLNNKSMSNSSVECSLSNESNESPLEIWIFSAQLVILKVPMVEMMANLRCKINNEEYVSKSQIMIAKLSKFTQHLYGEEFIFLPNENNEKKLNVTFSSPVIQFDDFFTLRSAFCVLDGNINKKINAIHSNNSIICDLSQVSGSHKLFVIRAPELLNSTLSHQLPIQINSLYQIQPISIQFNNQLTSIYLQFNQNLNECPSSVVCELFFEDVSHFEYCLVVNSSVEAILIPDSTILVDETIKVHSQIANNQCHLSVDELNQQKFAEFSIGNATDPIAPNGKIIQNQSSNQIQLAFEVQGGCGNSQCLCEWTILNSESEGSFLLKNGCNVSFEATELTSPINVQLNVCNFVEICSILSQLIEFNQDPLSLFGVQIIGINDQVYADTPLSLYARVNFNQNRQNPSLIDYNNLKFAWYINDEEMSQLPTLIIKAQSYKASDSITVTVNAQLIGEYITNSAMSSRNLKVINRPIVALIDSSSLSISINELLILNASHSYNPNNQSTTLQHNWKCTDLTTTTNQNCQLSSKINNGLLEVAGNSLTENHRYIFTDTIVSENLETHLDVIVNVNSPNLPQIQFIKMPNSISSTDYLKAKAQIRPNDDSLEVEWMIIDRTANLTILNSTNFHKFSQYYQNMKPSKPFTVSFTLPPNKLQLIPNQIYILKLMATSQLGSSFVDYEVKCSSSMSKTKIFVSPTSQIFALSTPVQFTVNSDSYNKIRFGLRTFLDGNLTKELWFIAKTTNKHRLFLPSTDQKTKNCPKIIGLQAISEICQPNGGCLKVESANFTVQKVINGLADQMKQLIEYDIQMGLLFDAYEKFNSLQLETCTQNYELCDKIAEKLIQQLEGASDMDELIGGMNYLSNILSENSCSSLILPDLLHSIGTIRNAILHSSPIEKTGGNRQKRSTDLLSAMSGGDGTGISEAVANTLLVAYDLLVSKNQNVVTVYLANLVDLLSGFCVQTDSTRTLSAIGQNYTTIQLQGLIPSYKTFLSTEYSLAGTKGKTILFDKEFQKTYNNWQCTDRVNCSEICLGSAQIKFSVLQVNDFMAAYFSTPSFSSVGLNQLVSDLYELVFMDPITGKQVFLTDGIGFTVRIPLMSYKPSFYYKCFTFTGSAWVSNYCRSAAYGISLNDSTITGLECTCNSGGFIGVFTVSAPNPQYYPQYNEINITMKLTTTSRCTPDDAKNFVQSISDATNLEKTRFQGTACKSGGWLSTILRPAFRQNQTSNSYAIQAIKKAILAPTGFNAYDSITVVNLTDTIIYRNLTNDGNARRIALRIDRSYKELVGNDSTILSQSWLSTMSTNMRVSLYRFKNPILAIGMLFNFTITVPFAGETAEENKLSAEEISIWIQEQTKYEELDIRNPQNERMPIDILDLDEGIVELIVASHVSSLMVILASVVSVICILASFCIGGLVFVKVRTDRLIERHNKNMQPLDISHNVPMTVLPFESQPLQINAMNDEEEAHLDFASDTVVFGKKNVKD